MISDWNYIVAYWVKKSILKKIREN